MGKRSARWTLLGLLAASHQAFGIAVEDLPVSEAPPTDEGYSFDWSFVYNCKGSTGVAVDHYWLLTAAHVADDGGSTLTVGGETYTQQEVVFHAQEDDPNGNSTADLALIRYDKPFPGYYLLADSVPLLEELLICGYGHSGDVLSEKFTAYFTSSGSGNGVRRWGTNRIDTEIIRTYTGPPPQGETINRGFDVTISTAMNNSGKTPYEAGCNVYDSGGGMFFNDSGTWKLTGHMTLRLPSLTPGQYAGNFAVATPYYVDWIKSVIVDYDSDQDGLPDWWEQQYGGGETSMTATNDLDGDQFTNYEEWLADTVPTNDASFLQLGVYTNASELVFVGSTNREYRIVYREDLADTNESWQTEVDWFDGEGPDTGRTASTNSTVRFYRLRVRRP